MVLLVFNRSYLSLVMPHCSSDAVAKCPLFRAVKTDSFFCMPFLCHLNFTAVISIIHRECLLVFPIRNEKKKFRDGFPLSFMKKVSDSQANNENTITRLGTEKPQRPWHKSLYKLRRQKCKLISLPGFQSQHFFICCMAPSAELSSDESHFA